MLDLPPVGASFGVAAQVARPGAATREGILASYALLARRPGIIRSRGRPPPPPLYGAPALLPAPQTPPKVFHPSTQGGLKGATTATKRKGVHLLLLHEQPKEDGLGPLVLDAARMSGA